jgi:hypothetical protein
LLRLAASLAGDIPVRLGDAVTGIDQRNAGLLVTAILHASVQRQFPRLPIHGSPRRGHGDRLTSQLKGPAAHAG